jgi:uncharacterized membrane protein
MGKPLISGQRSRLGMPGGKARSGMTARYDRLDALRGIWMLWMAGFHFAFDLALFRFTASNFYLDPFWTVQRTFILSGFLFWAGLGQGLAVQAGQDAKRFWVRWAQVAAAALLVSAGSALMFGQRWISFGVLHAFALLLPLVRWGAVRLRTRTLVLLALVLMVLPLAVQHPVFDQRWSNWVGLVTRKPSTEDFVPLLPWAGPMLLGLAASRSAAWLQGPAPRVLVHMGRWPLLFYLLHQPVFIGVLMWAQRSMPA